MPAVNIFCHPPCRVHSSTMWATAAALEGSMPAFAGLSASLAADAAAWQSWTADASKAEMPGGWGNRLTAFQHLLIVKVRVG